MRKRLYLRVNKNRFGMKKNRSDFDWNFGVIIRCRDNKVERIVALDGKTIYEEHFSSPTAWQYGGGNPVLDLFEKRFLGFSKEREDISCYRCDISNGGKGIRRILSEILHLQIKFLNILFKRLLFCRKSPYA